MPTQSEKCSAFRALHERDHAFILPNPYDAGTAKLLAHLGFEALATSSAGYAFTLGKSDNHVGRDAMLSHVTEVVKATDLPVSADLENGFGDDPGTAAETVRLAGDAGLAGCSIEDMRLGGSIYEFEHAVERIKAAVEAARSLPFAFTLTARCENYLCGRTDITDTIRRLQAYQEAGADVLYAPGLKTMEEIASVVRSVDRPVNVLPGNEMTSEKLSALGVKRISIGSGLARAALGAFTKVARNMKETGNFNLGNDAAGFSELNGIFGD